MQTNTHRLRRPVAPSLTKVLALALALVLAAPTWADVGPDVKISLTAPDGSLPVAGQPYSLTLELTSATGAVITAPTLRSGRTPAGDLAWEPLTFPSQTGYSLPAMQPVTFPIELQCNDPAQAVEIVLDLGGRSKMQRFYLLPQGLNSAMGGTQTIMAFDSDKGAPVRPSDDFVRPEPAPITRANVRDKRYTGGEKSPAGRTIRVHGRFYYTRDSYNSNGEYRGDGLTMGADGVTVRVYDSDWEWDDLLAQTVLGPDGYYDLSFWYNDSEAPDIYVEFAAVNSKVDLVYPSIWNTTYTWASSTKEDFNGTVINFGSLHPGSESHYAGLNALASATRTWRWFNSHGYGGIDNVLISWPDSDWPHYSPAWETIYMSPLQQWQESTVCHEYGHHWQQEYTETDGSDYCNPGNRCDTTGEDCRHCPWCEETPGDALAEGFPDWISNAVTATWPGTYGFEAIFRYNWESVNICTWNDLNQFDNPWKTEGSIAAFLQDVVDDTNEVDPNALGGGQDAITWSAQRVLNAQAADDPVTSAGLLSSLLTRYPESGEALWMTATNARFPDLDNVPPSALTGLTSTSHANTGDSPDGTVRLVWSAASDSYSGVAGYSVRVGPVDRLPPDQSIETTATNWTSDDLAPGTYWFSVAAVDRTGQLGTYATFGPVIIRNFTAADVVAVSGNWPYPVVPRLTADATSASAPLSNILVGNGNTYFNLKVGNSGELATSPTLRLNLYVDGALWWYSNIFTLNGYDDRAYLNIGPEAVPGGRHAVTMWADANEQMSEANEADNIYARQFVWYPYTLPTAGTWVQRQRPSDAWGGFTHNILSSPNCDGFVYSMSTAPFVGAVMIADDMDSDFDLRLHDRTTGSTSGFAYLNHLANSYRPAGCVEAVFSNNSLTNETGFDVGVINFPYDNYGFRIRRIASTSLTVGRDVQLVVSPVEPLVLRDFMLSGGSGADFGRVTLQVDPAVGPVRMKVMPAGVGHAGLDDTSYQVVTDANGFAKVTFAYAGATQGLIVWQDPRDIPVGGSGHFPVTVHADTAPPDFVPLTTAGWFAPLVPTNAAPGTAASTPLPATLVGNAPATYINVQFRNDGAGTAGAFDSMTYLDGTALLGEQVSQMGGFTDRVRNFPYAQTVRGGRHTLSMLPDATDTVGEDDESNNSMGQQYVWSPLALATGGVLDRPAPPDPMGGFAAVMAWSASPTWFNCDGLRTPLPAPAGNNGHWLAVATLPGAGSDVDLRLHEKVDSPLQGFTLAQALSVWGPAESDYLLVNFRTTAARQFDVGVLGTTGADSFRVATVASQFLDTEPSGTYGPFGLATTSVIALHEVWLAAGPQTVTLRETGGDGIDWGLTLHRGQLPYHAKSASAGVVGQVWGAAPGATEVMPVNVPQDGWYCLAVWKAGAADANRAGQYELEFDAGLTAVGGEQDLPTVTTLTGVAPNPFNPSTRLYFELAGAGPVRLEVYDVRGRLIRHLVQEDLPAGRHEVVWDGHDEHGDTAASGTYLARLSVAGVVSARKMLLLK